MKTKIEIKSIYGRVLFSYESENNTIKKTFEEAIKQRANLWEADLSGANLLGVCYNEGTGFLLPQCPSEGSFIAWKKAGGYIVKLLVCEDAKRSSATTLKCRCSKATVLAIENCDGTKADVNSVLSNHDNSFIYTIGETIEVKDFDEDRFKECSTGIHFFIAREMAVKY